MSKTKILKLVMFVVALVICIGATIYLFPVMRNLSTVEGQVAFKQKVENSGVLGLISLFALEVAQIFLFIIPGEPIEILAGMCYGALWGTVFIMVSAGLISTVIFFLVRKLGKKFVYEFCDENKVKKIENSKLFQNPKKIEMIMLILFYCLDAERFIVYIAGLLPIKPARFIVISTLARFPSVISSTLAGANIAVGDWKLGILLYGVIVVAVAVLIFIYQKFDKEKITSEALKTIK